VSNFYLDTICPDPRFHSVDRIDDPLLLEPITRQAVQNILAQAAGMGIEVMIFETFRSQPRQQFLWSQGATKLKTVGVHHYGLACDIVKVLDGEPSWQGDFSFLGDLAKENELIWGGDWGEPDVVHTFLDGDHVQRCTIIQQSGLFAGNWYPEGASDALAT